MAVKIKSMLRQFPDLVLQITIDDGYVFSRPVIVLHPHKSRLIVIVGKVDSSIKLLRLAYLEVLKGFAKSFVLRFVVLMTSGRAVRHVAAVGADDGRSLRANAAKLRTRLRY
jgi:hypothetical protein